ncbi:uncharacterized protein LOC144578777 isoform X3 [Callithrix jacchus]
MQTHSFGKFKSLKEGQKASEGRARTYTQGANWEPYGHAPLLSSLLRAEPGLKPQGPNSEPSSPRSPLPVILQMCPLWSWSGHTAASIVLLSRGNRASCDTPRPEVHPVAKPTLPQGSGHHQARPLPGGGAASRWSPEADATEQEVPGLPGWLQPAVAWPDSVTWLSIQIGRHRRDECVSVSRQASSQFSAASHPSLCVLHCAQLITGQSRHMPSTLRSERGGGANREQLPRGRKELRT